MYKIEPPYLWDPAEEDGRDDAFEEHAIHGETFTALFASDGLLIVRAPDGEELEMILSVDDLMMLGVRAVDDLVGKSIRCARVHVHAPVSPLHRPQIEPDPPVDVEGVELVAERRAA